MCVPTTILSTTLIQRQTLDQISTKAVKNDREEYDDYHLHFARRKAILKAFPEVKKLYGFDTRTQYIAYFAIVSQLTLAYLCRDSWSLALFFGVTIGPYIDAFVLVLIHEATHFMVFAKPAHNRLLSIFTNMVMCIPISEIFKQHHGTHHMKLGTEHSDVDIPTQFEIDFVGNSSVKKFLWLFFNMFFLPIRSFKKLDTSVNSFLILNWVVCIGFGILAFFYSLPSFCFLLGSALLSQGFHPANARMLQRHLYNGDETVKRNPMEPYTYSYYGSFNAYFLNVGYHVEHHDFHQIPWTRLPELTKIAGEEWYPSNRSYKSRGMADLINFVINPTVDLSCFGGDH